MSVAYPSEVVEVEAEATPVEPTLDPFDTRVFFERWLAEVNPNKQFHDVEAEDNSGIFIGSFPGSNCEVCFEGVLHFDGYSIGNITSPQGTLVLTKRGRIEADINVGVAVIGGWVTGDITASEHVILESEARVTGQIRTRALSVRLGAVFDGECLLSPAEKSSPATQAAPEKPSRDVKQLALGAHA